MFKRRPAPSDSTAAAPKFASSRRERDDMKAKTGAVLVFEIDATIACGRCGRPFQATSLWGIVMGVREGAGRPADVEILETTCPACKEASR